jgi:hypothetical protein
MASLVLLHEVQDQPLLFLQMLPELWGSAVICSFDHGKKLTFSIF